MKERVELIFDLDCPNVATARAALQEAFARAGLPPSWTEWDHKAPHSPPYVRKYGSPTILVDGADLAGVEPAAEADCCRVYLDGENGFRGVPPVDQIAAALTMGEHTPAARGSGGAAPVGWRGLLAVLPGLGAALLPVGTCPACWPAYAAFLGSIGLGFLFTENYLLPVTAAFLMLAVASLAYRSRSRHGYGPFGVGALAAIVALGGKFALASDPMLYAGLGMIVGASLWNAWPRKTAAGSCAACAPHAAQLTDATNTKEVAS